MKDRISEFDYIKIIAGMFSSNLPAGVKGIGDDCAVVPFFDNKSLLLTTDTLIDSVHFLSDRMPAYDIARKSLVVNISDIASMGGKPVYVLLALSVPKSVSQEWVNSFFSGLNEACEEYVVTLIGGDTTCSPDKIVITITVIGIADEDKIKYRSAAKTGDIISVTGIIGDSTGGLFCYLEEPAGLDEEVEILKKAHLNPRPHLREGQWLADRKEVGAMIDISDGIESDIQRILESSKCGADIELSHLPLSKHFSGVAEHNKWNRYEMAVSGGEDYCLLLTIRPEKYEIISEAYRKEFSLPLTAIGEIVDSKKGLIWRLHGEQIEIQRRGYDHFR